MGHNVLHAVTVNTNFAILKKTIWAYSFRRKKKQEEEEEENKRRNWLLVVKIIFEETDLWVILGDFTGKEP